MLFMFHIFVNFPVSLLLLISSFIPLHPFTFNPFVSLDHKFVLQIAYNYIFFKKKINSTNLCLFIRELNPFTFKLITDKKASLLTFCYLFSVWLIPLLSFPPYCLLSCLVGFFVVNNFDFFLFFLII